MNSFIPTPDLDAGPGRIAPPYRGTAAARRERLRKMNAGHQRLVRERRREAGEPDPGLLDRAIVDALRSVLLRCENSVSRPIDPRLVLALTREHLLQRCARAREADPEAPVYDGAAVANAVIRRGIRTPFSG
ncbi:hypothetical protein [Methylobacterium sp. J-077]|uniref:hypothetical protein n=1 Tax=Methylobacterium sp. J-077 TaxID=2836656 RepID=UPI001FBB931B|nr:hypothetical protein [Methylobacterium sp. J-077]MCJ2124572.1 hypothetical protein [Methylobacterium sp. J-077]